MNRVAILAGLLAAVALPASAQLNITEPLASVDLPAPQSPPQPGVGPSTEHLFGDWGGLRTRLENDGIYLGLDALTEFAGNVSGGTKQGSTFANQVAFTADVDWQRLAGVTGLSSHLIMVNRSGANDSNLFGDHLLPV
ncbi:MAG TPA: hypothetical protein VHX39_14710, partial [Acetobacteraceae bacterium]|nr:hypothetical protein [Acetobacteraceae bacterium]